MCRSLQDRLERNLFRTMQKAVTFGTSKKLSVTNKDNVYSRRNYISCGSNRRRIRQIVWAGQIKRIMTFAHAFDHLRAKRYQKMRSEKKSPLHVEPLKEKNHLFGYRRISTLHEKNNSWIRDIVSHYSSKNIWLFFRLGSDHGNQPW